MAKNYKRVYTVFSADPITSSQEVEMDGENVTIVRRVTSVQLIADNSPTLSLNVPDGVEHPFFEGDRVTVTFTTAPTEN